MQQIRAVAFDCDGVMFDTAEANRKYYNTVLSHFEKPPLTQEQFLKVHMYTVAEALAYLFPELDSLDPVYAFLKTMPYHQFIPYMQREKGLKTLLASLEKRGLLRAVATNRTNTMAAVLAAHNLENDFDLVVTAADVAHPKPAPDQLHAIMTSLGLSPVKFFLWGIPPMIRWRRTLPERSLPHFVIRN